MKSLILFAAIFAAVSALPRGNDTEPKGWYVPVKGGKFQWVSRDEYENAPVPEMRKSAEVKFYLYTKSNPTSPKQLYLNDKGTLSSSNFRGSLPTRVIIHGWENDFKSAVNTDIRSALLNIGSFNVICVDWSDKSVSLNYAGSKNAVPDVGRQVANFLDFLSAQGGMSFNKLTIIGHSLGAHVAGFTGKQVTRGKVNTIIGLDPAYPLFSYSDSSKRLSSSDATYVESIQTSGSLLGFLEPIGKAAFYPNGGKSQPGCGIDLTGSCAHSRSYQYYAEAVQRNNFKSIGCSDYNAAVKNKCGNSFSNIRMGTGYGNSGVFYVPINKKSPYGTG
ncbi:pancreatic triacylglycerol lipase-like [Episyrphus balteatus]|uniref:pancreatic triacylglycerol lipase-like n=1 Tax=Episyrphus balteatus TaxID=286459 RepID=UPI002486C3B4|nr:pancreatic triacylglycerol lipase-like [Episyrphus balteatus]